jgi:hypothetical protein
MLMRKNWLSSARARFVATAAVVFALVALGGVTAAPANADVTVTFTVYDNATGTVFSNQPVTLVDQTDTPFAYMTDASGQFITDPLLEGEYRLIPGSVAYTPTGAFTLAAGATTQDVNVDTYKVEGSLPVGLGAGLTDVTIQFDSGGSWTDAANTSVASSGGAFEFRLPSGPGDYRLFFQPAADSGYLETYSTTFTVDGSAGAVTIGAVYLLSAASISGNVVAFGTGLPVAGATAYAFPYGGGAPIASAVVDTNGDYRINLPYAAASYSVYVDATNYVRHYYDHLVEDYYATEIPINETDGWAKTGADFDLELDTSDVIINTLSGADPYAVDFTLYVYSDYFATWGSYPYYSSYQPESSLNYRQLPQGTYRLTASNPTTGIVLPINGDCYQQFSSVLVTNIVFTDAQVDTAATAATCDEPAWLNAGDASATGTVTNIDDLSYPAVAQLIGHGSFGSTVVVDSSPVNPTTGAFELSVPSYADNYAIKVITDPRDPVLDTILTGGSVMVWSSAPDVDSDVLNGDPIYLDPATPATLSGRDVTLIPGAILNGSATETGTGNPVVGNVMAIESNDNNFIFYSSFEANGDFAIKLPLGETYLLRTNTIDDAWVDEYWNNVTDVDDAEIITTSSAGVVGNYDFELDRTMAQLYVWPYDPDVDDEIIVHLYFKVGAAWEELETQTTTWGEAYFIQDYDTGLNTGLTEGDYRARFETLDGQWIEATESSWGKDASDGPYSESDTPSCFVDFEGLTSGVASYISFDYDISDQTTVCAPEPPATSTVTAHVESSAAWSSEDVANHNVLLYNDDDTVVGSTDSAGDIELDDVPNGTYAIEITPNGHIAGEHEYSYTATVVIGGGDVDLGTLVATRFGNVIAEFSNWDAVTMGTSYASVYVKRTDSGGDYWEPIGLTVEVSSTGTVEAPGVLSDGEYALRIEFGATYAPLFVNGGVVTPEAPFTGVSEEDYDYGTVALDLEELVQISGTVFYGALPLEDAVVIAHPIGAPDDLVFFTNVLADGSYSLDVAPGFDYEVAAIFPQLQIQFWLGNNYPIDHTGPVTATPVAVGTDPVENINFSLIAEEEVTFELLVEQWDQATDTFTDFDDVEVQLYKKVSNGWQAVDTAVSDPFTMLESAGDGEYRLRFSKDGQWLALHDIAWANLLIPYDESDSFEEYDPALCFYDFSGVKRGSYITAQLSLDPESSAVCGAEPPLVVPSTPPGTTPQPKPKPGAGTSGDAVTVEDGEPEPTATPTPTPVPSDTPDDESAAADPAATSASGPNLTWAFVVAGVLVLLALSGGAVYFVRRRP